MIDLRKILEDPSTGDEGSNKLSITDVMRTATDRVYMKLNDVFDIQINKTDEGIVIDVFSCNPNDDANESIASTYAFDNEVMTEDQYEAAHPN
jgi:hypothetical protein